MTMNRRTMLLGSGASLSLPLLESLASPISTNSSNSSPRRLIYLYFPNGVAAGTWNPEEVDRNGKLLKLNRWMSPLEPFKEDLIIPRNLWMPEGDGHLEGPPNWLTAKGFNDQQQRVHGASVDQVAAVAMRNQTMLPSLELSIKGEGFFSNSLPRNSISWSQTLTPLPRETEPQSVFDRMFRPPSGGATHQSVLDSVLQQASQLRKTHQRCIWI